MARIDCFEPVGATVNLAVTSTTGRVARTLIGEDAAQVRIVNAGTVTVFLAFGGSSIDATTSGMPLLPGTAEVFTLTKEMTNIAAITASGTATIYATTGRGA